MTKSVAPKARKRAAPVVQPFAAFGSEVPAPSPVPAQQPQFLAQQPQFSAQPSADEIARRAYERYLQRHDGSNDAIADWYAAEVDLGGAAAHHHQHH